MDEEIYYFDLTRITVRMGIHERSLGSSMEDSDFRITLISRAETQ